MQKPEWEQRLPAGYRMATEADRGTLICGDWKAWMEEWVHIQPGVVGVPLQPSGFNCHVPMCIPLHKEQAHSAVETLESVGMVPNVALQAVDASMALKPFTPNKYTRWMPTLDGRKVPVDVYCVLAAFPTGSAAVDHAVKKQLAPGQRGHKDRIQDLKEARDSLTRAIELEEAANAP